jgi:hypothetical protein
MDRICPMDNLRRKMFERGGDDGWCDEPLRQLRPTHNLTHRELCPMQA